MVRKTYLPEQIINKLREDEILLNQGATVIEASRLKRLVADLSLDNTILKEASRGNS